MTYTTSWPSWFETTNQVAPICENGPCQTCIQVAMVDEEINQAISCLRRLVAKRCHLRSEQNRVHGKLMHRLPIELKNHIFQLLLPPRTNWGRIRQSEDSVMPTYLASICRGWRDIAWSNPFLWSTIVIVPRGETADQFGIPFVRDWITRSQTLPLTLCIVARKQEELKGVIDAIGQCSIRWHSLSLEMPLKLLRTLQHHTNLQYHQLKKLQILVPNRSLWDNEIDQPVPLLNPAGLVEVGIHGVSLQSLPLSWTHLSVAHLQANFGLEDVVQLLQHASQMTKCVIISLQGAARLGNFSMPPITHKCLKILGLYNTLDPSVVAMLLAFLTLPKLQEFRTTNSSLLSPAYIPALAHRSSCPLTSIKFFGVFIPFSDLRPLPGVTDLVLDTTKDNFVGNLLDNFFPDLRYLTLRLKMFLSLWDQGIISMLLARKQVGSNGSQLRKLIVEQRDQADGPTLEDMWNSDVGKELRAMNTRLTECGFEVFGPDED